MAIEQFNHIKDVLDELDNQRPARFGYTEAAVNATGEAEIAALEGLFIVEDSTQINSIPTPDLVGMDPVIINIGLRTQAATISRMAINHFFGRLGLNLLKVTEKLKLLVNEHLVSRYITPTGNVLERITVTQDADEIILIQHRSPLSASAPVTTSAPVTLSPAVYDGNAGVMTGADKKVLDDLNTAFSNLGSTAVLLTTDQSIGGVKTFTSIPLLPGSDPTLDNQAVRKRYVDARTNDVLPLSYLDTDPTMTADSDLKIPSQKAVNTNFKNININNKLIALRHLEKYPTALSQASHRLLEIGGDYIIMGSNANGSYWRSYRGNYPVLLNSGTSNLLDYSGMCVWLQNNEWLFNFRNGGLYYCPDISIATPIFISRIAGSFVYRDLTRVVENGEIVVYGVEKSNQQVIKLTNNGLTQVVLYTAPQPISSMAKIGNKLIAIVESAPTYIYYSLDLGTTWQSTTLTPTSPRVSNGVFALKNVFCIPAVYNNTTPMIYTSETGETWSLKYTGNNSAYSLDLKPINVDDKFFVWLEKNSAGGFRIMHTFTEDFSQIEIPIVHSSGAPSVCKFFENMFIVSGSGTTPDFWKSPPLL